MGGDASKKTGAKKIAEQIALFQKYGKFELSLNYLSNYYYSDLLIGGGANGASCFSNLVPTNAANLLP